VIQDGKKRIERAEKRRDTGRARTGSKGAEKDVIQEGKKRIERAEKDVIQEGQEEDRTG
jgi:hypothetical protein